MSYKDNTQTGGSSLDTVIGNILDSELFKPNKKTEHHSCQLSHELCCRVAAFAVIDAICKAASENAKEHKPESQLGEHRQPQKLPQGVCGLGAPRLAARLGRAAFEVTGR